jgi:hypothetical protein
MSRDKSARRFAQDDDFAEGSKSIWAFAKNTKSSKKSQALRMTALWGDRKASGHLQKKEKVEKVTGSARRFAQDDGFAEGSKSI